MQKTWIVAADATRARIFELLGAEQKIHEIEDFAHPAGRSMTRELQSDGQGRFYGKGERNQGHTNAPERDAAEHENDLFSKSLADYLDEARTQHRYERLRIVAPPKILGLLRQKLHKEVQKLVEDEVPKDISWFAEDEIERFLQARK